MDSSSFDVLECPLNMASWADKSVCIPDSWLCDGDSDCADHSDEFDCSEDRSLMVSMQSNHRLCGYHEFRCSGSALCIPNNQTCDDVKDCPSGDGEGSVCDACKQLHCSWRCQKTSIGSEEMHVYAQKSTSVSLTEEDAITTARIIPRGMIAHVPQDIPYRKMATAVASREPEKECCWYLLEQRFVACSYLKLFLTRHKP